MSHVPAGALSRGTVPPLPRSRGHLRLVQPPVAHQHDWRLRDVEEADGLSVRRFECDGCGGVDFA